MRRKKGREQWLEWCLNFISVDLEALSDADRIKLAADASELTKTWIFSKQTLMFVGPRKNLEDSLLLQRINEDSTHEELIEKLKEINLEKLQTCARGFFQPLLEFSEKLLLVGHYLEEAPTSLKIVNPMPIAISVGYSLPGLNRFPYGLRQATFSISFIAGSHEEAFLFQVSRLLEEVPLSVFRKCKECSKWFVHAGAREKLFCSNRCAARYGIRDRRRMMKGEEEDAEPAKREKEMRANAERAHEYYVKKHRAAGKSGTPARRPYKYKGD